MGLAILATSSPGRNLDDAALFCRRIEFKNFFCFRSVSKEVVRAQENAVLVKSFGINTSKSLSNSERKL